MKTKPYVVAEYYYPKSEHFDDVMNILKETSAMIKEQDGALMSMSLGTKVLSTSPRPRMEASGVRNS